MCVCVCRHVSTGGRKTNHPASALRKMSMSFWDLWSMEGSSGRTMSSRLHLHIQLAPFLSGLGLIKLLFLFEQDIRAACASEWSNPCTGRAGYGIPVSFSKCVTGSLSLLCVFVRSSRVSRMMSSFFACPFCLLNFSTLLAIREEKLFPYTMLFYTF